MEKKSIETINVYYKQAESGRLLPILVAMTSITTLIINLLLTEREGQYSPVRLQQARLVSSLLYGIVFLGEETLPVISFKKTSGAMSVDLTCLMTRAAQKRVELFITLVLKHSLFCCSKCF